MKKRSDVLLERLLIALMIAESAVVVAALALVVTGEEVATGYLVIASQVMALVLNGANLLKLRRIGREPLDAR